MANIFKNLFKKTSTSVLGVDIGPSSIKVVQLKKKKGRAVLETYGALALGPYAQTEVGRATHLPPAKIAEALVDLLRESSTTTKKIGLSIPMSSSLVVEIEVPVVDEKQLSQIIPLEARKYVPIPISEVSMDWWVIPKEQAGTDEVESEAQEEADRLSKQAEGPGGKLGSIRPDGNLKKIDKMSVLLVVIHNEAITHAQEIVKLSGLDASFFEIEIFSTIRSVLDRESDPIMIIDMGAGSTKLYIIDRGLLKVSHIITHGSQDLTMAISRSLNISVDEAESMKRAKGLSIGDEHPEVLDVMKTVLDYIFSETSRVVLGYQKKYNKDLNRAVLTGGGTDLVGFADLASKELQMSVTLADPFSKTEAPAFLEQVLRQAGPEFAVATGLALRKLQEIG